MYLSERLDSRNNNLGLIRLVAAFMVLFGHSFALRYSVLPGYTAHDALSMLIHPYMAYGQGLAGIGVHVFFFISGLLVARSFLRNSYKPLHFVAARVLRLFPGYWVNLVLITFVLAPIVTVLPLREYFAHSDTWKYFSFSVFLWPMYLSPAGVFEELPFSRAVNGSMWTLPIEGQMYIWCLGLGLLGILRRRWLMLAFVVAAVTYELMTGKDAISMTQWGEPRLWVFFFLGCLACVFADRIRISLLWLVLLAVPLPFISHHMAYWLYCAVYTGYVCLYLAYGHYRRELDISRIGDFSYGVYLYAYPVQQTLLHYSKLSISGWELVWYSGLVTSLFAVASWYLVEQPALRLKPGKRPEAAPAAQSLPAAA